MSTCPRRLSEAGPWRHEEHMDMWHPDETCSFCGSLNPDKLMRLLEAGTVELGPTDKNYKAYVDIELGTKKFYFVHLSEAQMRRFVELLNERKLKIGYPGHFYVKPFFIGYEAT